jgi:hypothetical protein
MKVQQLSLHGLNNILELSFIIYQDANVINWPLQPALIWLGKGKGGRFQNQNFDKFH